MLKIKEDPRDLNPDKLKENYDRFLELTKKTSGLKKVIRDMKKGGKK